MESEGRRLNAGLRRTERTFVSWVVGRKEKVVSPQTDLWGGQKEVGRIRGLNGWEGKRKSMDIVKNRSWLKTPPDEEFVGQKAAKGISPVC